MRKRKKKPGKRASPKPSALAPFRSGQASGRLARAAGRGLWLALLAAGLVADFSTPSLAAKKKEIVRSVTGVVLDREDNGIVGAAVELKDVQTGKRLSIFTEEGGRYKFSGLQPTHDYEVRAKDKGLSSEIRKVSSFDDRTTFVINLKIPPDQSDQR
jgi:hypothetical protein